MPPRHDPMPDPAPRPALTRRQRQVLASLSRQDGQRASMLAPSHAGNVLERLLARDYIRVDADSGRVYLTDTGRRALG